MSIAAIKNGERKIQVPRGQLIYTFRWLPRLLQPEAPVRRAKNGTRSQPFIAAKPKWTLNTKAPDPVESFASYTPNEWEEPYFDRLPKEQRTTLQSKPGEQGHANFQLSGRLHQFVSWFGIVREVTPNVGRRGGALLIENKYYNGTGDDKLQTVSIRGGGNFKGQMTNLSGQLVPPILVRVYGALSAKKTSCRLWR